MLRRQLPTAGLLVVILVCMLAVLGVFYVRVWHGHMTLSIRVVQDDFTGTAPVGSPQPGKYARCIITVEEWAPSGFDRATHYYGAVADARGICEVEAELDYPIGRFLVEASTPDGQYGYAHVAPSKTQVEVKTRLPSQPMEKEYSYKSFRGGSLREPVFLNGAW